MDDQRINADTSVRTMIGVIINFMTRIKSRKLYSYKKVSSQFSNRFFYFVNHSRLHGIRYLDYKYSIIERTYWICVLIASFIAMIVLFVYTLNDYLDSQVVIDFDAINLNKDSVFPGVSVCIEKYDNDRASTQRVKSFVQKYYAEHDIEEPQHEDYYDQLMSYAYAYHIPGKSETFKELDACNTINSTCGVDIETIKQLLFPYCNELFSNIQFNSRRFYDCNDLFKRQLIYDEGVCFTVNSIYFYNFDWDKLPLTYNKYEGGSKFTFDLFQRKGYIFYIFFHSPDGLPSIRNGWYFNLYDDMDQEIILQTTQVLNTDNVRDVSIEKRQCRFPDERWPLNASLPYNFVSCLIYTRVQIELKLCNCTLHFAPSEYKNQYCNYEQMKCIAEKETKQLGLDHHKYIEPCLSSCTEMHIDLVGIYKKKKLIEYESVYEGDPISGVTTMTVEINSQPEQLTRSVRLTILDLIVSFGSIIGLFFGATSLSLIEIIHFWIFRRF